MYNVVGHFQACKKEKMTPIIGVELPVQVVQTAKSLPRPRYITLIAKNYDGYATLMKIVSESQTRNQHTPHLPLSQFPDCQGNIIALINAHETPLSDMIRAGQSRESMIHALKNYEEVFGEGNVVLEVIPQSPTANAHLANANRILRDLHIALPHIPIIASSSFHYISEGDKEYRDIARCIKDGTRVYDDDRRITEGEFYIMSEDEIRDQCTANGFSEDQIDLLCETTVSVAEGIDLVIPLGKLLFPIYESPAEIVDLYAKFMEKESG
jgi:DNA polymerase III alpha subunit